MPCYNIEFSMVVTVSAVDHEEAEQLATAAAEAQLTRSGMGCLIAQPAEETRCD